MDSCNSNPHCPRISCTSYYFRSLLDREFWFCPVAAAAKSRRSCPTLCDSIEGSPPGSSFPGNLQARTLKWVVISFSNAWKWKVKVKSLSRVRLFTTPWTAAHQAPPSMWFSRQEHWSGLPLPSPLGWHLCPTESGILAFWVISDGKKAGRGLPNYLACVNTQPSRHNK